MCVSAFARCNAEPAVTLAGSETREAHLPHPLSRGWHFSLGKPPHTLRPPVANMADRDRKKRTFKKFSFRGKDLEGLLQLSPQEVMDLLRSRARRKFRRGTTAPEVRYLKKLNKAKSAAKENDGILEKPATVKTHMRNMTIIPAMVGCVCGVYSGKHYVTVEVKVRPATSRCELPFVLSCPHALLRGCSVA
jgi:small subunit ribosomal protein S15e